MRLVIFALVLITIYLVREVSVLKLNISNISNQNTQVDIQPVSSPHPRLLFWDSEVSPNGKYLMSSYTGDYADRYHYYQVFITELATDKMHRIYTGDYRTLDSEWVKDNRIKISYGCGTGCKSTRIIDLEESVSFEHDKSGKWTTETYSSF